MIIKDSNYQKAIDAINKLLDSGRIKVKSELWYQLKRECAGFYAEKQMSYELTRYFQDSQELQVYNNLHISYGAVKAQIDHLVCTRRAYYIIESKSISGVISVNHHGEFTRNSKQIKSPISQVKSQGAVLKDLFNDNLDKILGKFIGIQKKITVWTQYEYVAISEKAKISGTGRKQFADVLVKYDQVAEKILQKHKEKKPSFIKDMTRKNVTKFIDTEEIDVFSKKEFQNLILFLRDVDISKEPIDKVKDILNTPKYKADILPKVHVADKCGEVKKPVSFSCNKCGSDNIHVLYGRSYYFKCYDCDGNTPIKLTCDSCGKTAKTRKQKNEFYKKCMSCDTEVLYFMNE